ncbi:MAG: fibronectin type III domain-containing protein [Verrucomicrobiae bacterium]|nr:fibronectin type III domain-containing protein [Verrucomicrobiae bacterium]
MEKSPTPTCPKNKLDKQPPPYSNLTSSMLPKTIPIQPTLLTLLCLLIPLKNAPATIVDSLQHQHIAYLLQSSPARILRYDLATKQWLAAIQLPNGYGTPSKFNVDSDNYYIVYGGSVYRFTNNNLTHTLVYSAQQQIKDVIIAQHTLYIYYENTNDKGVFVVLNKSNLNVIQTYNADHPYTGFSKYSPTLNKFFALISHNSYQKAICSINLDASGNITSIIHDPHDGKFPIGTKTWLSPSQSYIIQDGSVAYNTSNLNYVSGLGAAILDAAFSSDGHLIVRTPDNRLVRLNQSFLPVGGLFLNQTPTAFFAHNQEVILFYSSPSSPPFGISTQFIPFASIVPPPFSQPSISTSGIKHPSFLDNYGILYLVDSQQQAIHRWSTNSQQYLQPIPLNGHPMQVTYSPSLHCIYLILSFSLGSVYKIDLNNPNPTPFPFINFYFYIQALIPVGTHLVVVPEMYPLNAKKVVFNSSGSLVSTSTNDHSYPYTWCPINKRLYTRVAAPYYQIYSEKINIDTDGSITDTIYSTSLNWYSSSLSSPFLRIAPDGSLLVDNFGHMLNPTTLNLLPTVLPFPIVDVAWLGNDIYTLRFSDNNQSLFQKFVGQNYSFGPTKVYPGTPCKLFSLANNKLLGISFINGSTTFYVLDSDFNILPPPNLQAPQNLNATISANQTQLQWHDISGETEYIIQRKIGPNGTWSQIGTNTINNTTFSDSNVTLGFTYHYRVIAKNGNLLSPPSNEVAVTYGLPSPPQNLTATPSTSQITLNWTPPPGIFMQHIFRSLTPNGPWDFVQTVNPTATTYTHTGLAPLTTYYYHVVAQNGFGTSLPSNTASATTPNGPPPSPEFITTPYIGYNWLHIQWTPVPTATSYTLERSYSHNGPWTHVITTSATSHLDMPISSSVNYIYRLTAHNSLGSSPPVTTNIYTPFPTGPHNASLQAFIESPHQIKLHWKIVSAATLYEIQRKTNNSTLWTTLATFNNPTTTQYTDTTVQPNNTYTYRIIASNPYGSVESNEVTLTPTQVTCIHTDTFDPDASSTLWQTITGGSAINGGNGFHQGKALWFGAAGERSAQTIPIYLHQLGYLKFKFRAGHEILNGQTHWDNADAAKSVILEYSTDNGTTWHHITTLPISFPHHHQMTDNRVARPPPPHPPPPAQPRRPNTPPPPPTPGQ